MILPRLLACMFYTPAVDEPADRFSHGGNAEHVRENTWSNQQAYMARLAQSAERKALNLVVVGSSPTVGVLHFPCR